MKEYLQENLGNILKEVELYEVYERYGHRFCKIVLRLIDGSSFHIWEKRKEEKDMTNVEITRSTFAQYEDKSPVC